MPRRHPGWAHRVTGAWQVAHLPPGVLDLPPLR